MDRFVHRQNLERFRRMLETETDESRRKAIMSLLAEEEAQDGGAPVAPAPKPGKD